MDHEGNGLRIKIKVRNGSNDDGKKQVCSIGHMRIHSETTMEKGLLFQPSTPAAATRRSSSSSSFSSSSSAVVDCSISLPSWSLTGRRGRKSTSTTAAAAATTTVLIFDVLPGANRMEIETHLDNEKLPKRKVHSEENKNESYGEGIQMQ
ncbi:unnamed protein product [Citrullus colocynthis]|uniref:Uncharacterized protein n=1 Tax=Citrullus colocynthis TaxID=252529 RepID=A0ABP0YT95_9ROSI